MLTDDNKGGHCFNPNWNEANDIGINDQNFDDFCNFKTKQECKGICLWRGKIQLS